MVGMNLTSRQHPRAGESNPKHPTAGAIAEGAITQESGENQRRPRRVPLTLPGREKEEAGRKTLEAGECLLQDRGNLEPEEMAAGQSQCPSVPVGLLKVGVASPRMAPVVVVEQGAWALGVAQAR